MIEIIYMVVSRTIGKNIQEAYRSQLKMRTLKRQKLKLEYLNVMLEL